VAQSPGKLVAFGSSGNSTSNDSATVNFPTISATAISAGGWRDDSGTYEASHALALTADGALLGLGSNQYGQLDIPQNLSAVSAGGWHSLAIVSGTGRVIAAGFRTSGATTLPAALASAPAVAVSAGGQHSLALLQNGTVVGWGSNSDGQAIPPPSLANQPVVAVAAGGKHSLALTSNGQVVGFGADDSQQSSVPLSLLLQPVVAIAAGSNFSLALTSSGAVVAWGAHDLGQTTVPPSATSNVTAVAAGGAHALALLANGSVVGWGSNADNQIDIPSLKGGEYYNAIAAGYRNSLAIIGGEQSMRARHDMASFGAHLKRGGFDGGSAQTSQSLI
jgi:alpha-tubulin suppressor-like RCC1 family protein